MDKQRPAPHAAPLGMALFLVALGVLFVASLLGFLITRGQAATWPPPGLPGLPGGLWGSTALLVASSGTLHLGLRGARRGDARALGLGLLATLILGLCFLASQSASWLELLAALRQQGASWRNLYVFCFYFLTGLHAAHVLGGLIPLVVTTAQAFRGRYTAESHMGVRLMAMYWHFLDGVWLVLFVALLAGS